MSARRFSFRSLTLRSALFSVVTLAATAGCPTGDVGAPCSHGEATPTGTKMVTFPAVSCNDLICIYGDDKEPPESSCMSDADCNVDGVSRYACNNGECELSFNYFLERSMCSKRCSSDSDCENTGITTANKPVADDITRCDGGFRCAVVARLGQFCCEKLCVCNDDIADAQVQALATECSSTFPSSGRPITCGCKTNEECGDGQTCDVTSGNCF